MAKQRRNGWVVRITLQKQAEQRDRRFKGMGVDLLVTEILRYAGLGSVVEETPERLVFDIGDDKRSQHWADMNTARIRSFMIQAESIHKYA
jgi:hypothetical protein